MVKIITATKRFVLIILIIYTSFSFSTESVASTVAILSSIQQDGKTSQKLSCPFVNTCDDGSGGENTTYHGKSPTARVKNTINSEDGKYISQTGISSIALGRIKFTTEFTESSSLAWYQLAALSDQFTINDNVFGNGSYFDLEIEFEFPTFSVNSLGNIEYIVQFKSQSYLGRALRGNSHTITNNLSGDMRKIDDQRYVGIIRIARENPIVNVDILYERSQNPISNINGNSLFHQIGFKFHNLKQSEFTSQSGFLLAFAVPEPSSWMMLCLGFAVLGMALRRTQCLTNNGAAVSA